MESKEIYLSKPLEDFQEITKKPEIFLSSENGLTDLVKNNLKIIYDFSKTQEKKNNGSKGLRKLLIQNFDIEQIWQEIELQNSSILSNSLNQVTRLIVNKNKLLFSNLAKDEKSYENEYEDEFKEDGQEVEENDIDDEDDLNEDDMDAENTQSKEDGQDVGEKDINNDDVDAGDTDEDMKDDKNSDEESKTDFSTRKKSIVDDKFFKLDEMENFLNVEDKKEFNEKPIKNTEESESDEEESIDLFENEEENLEEETDKSRVAKFKDFFRSNEPQKKDTPKRNKFLEGMSDDENEEAQQKSSFELRNERLKQRIDELEKNAISEKPWTLKGEIRAENRPQNSLLEEILEFDLTSRPAPVITENTTYQLEDIIIQRIKDKVFDSVVRKEKPIETPLEYKKKLTLDQEKSKHSLAQIYEKEYLDQQAALDPANADKEEEEPALHREVKKMMSDLFNKLDALSNFHFTPKPALPELRVVNNLPAIAMEEVAPVTATEASLLAPEEIRNKTKGEILGASEKTKTDKNRERRKKKLKQKQHKQIISKNMLPNGKTQGKSNISDVLKNRNTHKMEESSSKSVKSSKAFFTQLQEQAQAHIGKKLQSSGKKKEKNKIDARKIKL